MGSGAANTGSNEVGVGFADPETTKFPLADLQKGTPDGVDPKCKPLYLSAEEFTATFGMTLAAYNELKDWR